MNQKKEDNHSSEESSTTMISSEKAKKDLEKMVNLYLASNPVYRTDSKVNELEIRFGTNPKLSRPISKIDYENVVKKLYSTGFTTINAKGTHLLRIQSEYIDPKSGITKVSNIRAEIVGVDMIQEYCKSNSLQKIIDMTSSVANVRKNKVKFTQKVPPTTPDHLPLRSVNFEDFNFRVSYQLEQDYSTSSDRAKIIINKWTDSKKLFRHINRVRFSHPDLPLFADISIVKGNKKTKKVPIPQYTIQDAGVFETQEHYEIELEIDNQRVGTGTPYSTTEKLLDAIRKGVRIILSGLQGTNYPISYGERETILQEYMRMLHGEEYQQRYVRNSDFIGPSSYTLQLENVVEDTLVLNVPNIQRHYTVTDKADGERRLLYIAENGRIYMIDTNMNVIFTGTMTREKTLHRSLMDGEYIPFDKTGKRIYLYAAFDLYYVHGKSIREHAFMKIQGEEEELDHKYRLLQLLKATDLIRPVSILDDGKKETPTHSCDFIIKCKQFYSTESQTIFQGCATILSEIKDEIYQYNTDGLIFTPSNTGVASDRVGVSGPLSKITWDRSFKWKPAEFNTIDFLVSVKKDKNGKDIIHHIFQEGKNLVGVQSVVQYKTLILRCGFSEKKHGFLNPMQNLIDDVVSHSKDVDSENDYKPVPFLPTDPYDPNACYCNVLLQETGEKGTQEIGSSLVMKTEEGEYFEEDMIVEFKYDLSLENGWRWIPLRVRYDKTAELRAGGKNYGNAYHVANNNWYSIHHPITEIMISTGEGFPEYVPDEDVYYNRTGKESNTLALRNFHNLYVKRKLITGVAERKDTLIDYAVGKAGDLSKWIQAKLGFVFGVDISKDNINHHLDGACARYLKERLKSNEIPRALFVVGNSGLNIRSGEAFSTEKDKMIAKSVFGNGPKDRQVLGEGVYKNYGIAQEGFQISSCQFAMHYFFENQTTLHSFLRNLAECTRMGGYFIGTCYDGKTVFQLLKRKIEGEGEMIMKNGKKIYEITKMYNETGFADDETSVGYAINVYQETINKVFREYLVNFQYFQQVMEDYGFVLVSREEADKMGLPSGSGLFGDLYTTMENEVRRQPKKSNDYGEALKMSAEEKRISFMNRYFVFKKMRTVNADKVGKILTKYNIAVDRIEARYEEEHHDALRLTDQLLEKEKDKEEVLETAITSTTKAAAEKPEKPKRAKRVQKIKTAKFTLSAFEPAAEETDKPRITIGEEITLVP